MDLDTSCSWRPAESVFPATKYNRDGLSGISYRIGTHRQFKAALTSRLSSSDFPALNTLTTRSEDDFTIALCDAFSTLADVVTFYQERIANETYLRTAIEHRSVMNLARLVGYHLSPGIAAATCLAFTLDVAPGAPELSAQPVAIPVGTRVQSVPDHGQDPQTFETTAEVIGRVAWNAIPAQLTERLSIQEGLTELYLAGTSLALQIGEVIGLIGQERESDPRSARWDTRALSRVEIDPARNITHVTWARPLGAAWTAAVKADRVSLHVFRQRAALFGHNAPDPNLFAIPPALVDVTAEGTKEWRNLFLPNRSSMDLDAPYPKIAAGTWTVLTGTKTSSEAYHGLHRVYSNFLISLAGFGLSARVSRLTIEQVEGQDTTGLRLRETQVLGESQPLALAERPLLYPVYGSEIALDRRQSDLSADQLVAFSGKRQRVVARASPVKPPPRPIAIGDTFFMHRPPEQFRDGRMQVVRPEDLAPGSGLDGDITWFLEAGDGTCLAIEAPLADMELVPSERLDPTVSEVAVLAFATALDDGSARTTLKLQAPLRHCYERWLTAINANVAPATHGETVAEAASSAGSTHETIALKHAPLTYVSSVDGRASTLEVRVNDIVWSEVATLRDSTSVDHVYALRHADDGNLMVYFGDGVNGARLPRGDRNVRLRYRKGIGAAGNLRQGQLSVLITRPLGVKSALNPVPATGGQDPESLDDARRNAPLPTLTLGRAVSIYDYVDYARSFPGIAKAHGRWIDDFRARGVHLTIAAPGGAPLAPSSEIFANLIGSLRRYGDPLLAVSVQSYAAATFRLTAKVTVAATASREKVLKTVGDTLLAAYSFERREFAQSVTIDEVYASIQRIPDVVAATIVELCRSDAPTAASQAVLPARGIVIGPDGQVEPAELLTIDATALAIGV